MQQKLFQYFLSLKAGASGNNKKIRKGTAKATPKIEKIYILHIYKKRLICLKTSASDGFLQKCIDFVEQRLKFSHFEGSIIP